MLSPFSIPVIFFRLTIWFWITNLGSYLGKIESQQLLRVCASLSGNKALWNKACQLLYSMYWSSFCHHKVKIQRLQSPCTIWRLNLRVDILVLWFLHYFHPLFWNVLWTVHIGGLYYRCIIWRFMPQGQLFFSFWQLWLSIMVFVCCKNKILWLELRTTFKCGDKDFKCN